MQRIVDKYKKDGLIDRQIDRYKARQKVRQIDIKKDKQIKLLIYRYMYRQIDKYKQKQIDRYKGRQKVRQIDIKKDKYLDKMVDIQVQRQIEYIQKLDRQL